MAQNSRRKNYRIRYDRIIFVVIMLVVFILILTSCISSCGKKKTGSNPTNPLEDELEDQLETLPGGAPAVPVATEGGASSYSTITKNSEDIHAGDLILINAVNPCKYDYDAIAEGTSAEVNFVTIKSILDTKENKHYTASDWEVGLDRTAAYAMDAWFEGFYNETGNTDIRMIKGYSSDSGDLDFRSGRTLTMGIYPDSGSSNFYKPEGIYVWLADHAAEYGFIQRYPDGKESFFDDTITSRTSATYRYVGVAAATYMKEHELCLEEFLDEIKSYSIDSMLRVTSGDAMYGMYYIPSNSSSTSTNFAVPSGDATYVISGNNYDGFIITVGLNTAAQSTSKPTPSSYDDVEG